MSEQKHIELSIPELIKRKKYHRNIAVIIAVGLLSPLITSIKNTIKNGELDLLILVPILLFFIAIHSFYQARKIGKQITMRQ